MQECTINCVNYRNQKQINKAYTQKKKLFGELNEKNF